MPFYLMKKSAKVLNRFGDPNRPLNINVRFPHFVQKAGRMSTYKPSFEKLGD
jgi:hypothetical protein